MLLLPLKVKNYKFPPWECQFLRGFLLKFLLLINYLARKSVSSQYFLITLFG